MRQAFAGVDFAPIPPLWMLGVLAVVAMLVLVPGALRRARGVAWRAAAFALLLLALANPRLVEETRETRPDIALLVVDRSDSARINGRDQRIDAARELLEQRIGRLPELELRSVVYQAKPSALNTRMAA